MCDVARVLTTGAVSKSKAIRATMAATRTYLDYNATAPLRSGALTACLSALATYGNPSSVHQEGRAARALVEGARAQVAALLGQAVDTIAFTSGGTEGANLLLTPGLGSAYAPHGARRLIVSASEHPAVLEGHRFAQDAVTVLPVCTDGRLDLDRLRDALAQSGPALVALQAANNETGVVQPVREAADLVHERGGLLVCDAVQIVGRMPFSLEASGADAAVLSGHKLGGPKGTGAVALRDDVTLDWPLIRGGGQERGRRSGTENVTGIAGLGAAAEEATNLQEARIAALRDKVEAEMRALRDDIVIFGASAPRLPNTSSVAVPGIAAETLLMALDLDGVAVSSGAACSSGKVGRSHVLAAMGVAPELAAGALRVSFGWGSTEADVARFVESFTKAMQRLQKRSLPHAA